MTRLTAEQEAEIKLIMKMANLVKEVSDHEGGKLYLDLSDKERDKIANRTVALMMAAYRLGYKEGVNDAID